MTDYTELVASLRERALGYDSVGAIVVAKDSRQAADAIEALQAELAEARKPVLLPPGIPTLIPRDERERVISQESMDAGYARGLQENADDEGYARGFIEGREALALERQERAEWVDDSIGVAQIGRASCRERVYVLV